MDQDHLPDEIVEDDEGLSEEVAEDDEDLPGVTASDDDRPDDDVDDAFDDDVDGPSDEGDDGRADEDADDDDTDFATVASAATVEEARRIAVDQLRKIIPSVDEADVEFVVLEEGSRGGFFGRGKMLAQVEARLRPAAAPSAPLVEEEDTEAGEHLREFLEQVLSLMGIEATVEASETPEGVRADISGEELGLLIGRHGSTIDALQYIAAIVVNGDRRQRRQVVVDAEGYRVRRESILRAVAERTAQRAARENTAITLKPMSAAERKVVHLYLKDHPRVETVSEGNEPFRSVIVSPRRRG